MEKQDILNQLAHFTGSKQIWEHKTFFGKLMLTDGCDFVRKECQAYWLFDLIFSHQSNLVGQEFQSWTLKRTEGCVFHVVCDDGDDNVLLQQSIPFSDFPLDELQIWLVDGTCLLPSEY